MYATKVQFVGPSDQYFSGVPQGEPEPDAEGRPIPGTHRAIVIGVDVTLEKAREIVASGLYRPVDGELAPLSKSADAPASEEVS